MRYFLLKDSLCPAGDIYRVHEDQRVDMEAGSTWMAAFNLAAEIHGTTPFEQLQDYARKYGSLEEIYDFEG